MTEETESIKVNKITLEKYSRDESLRIYVQSYDQPMKDLKKDAMDMLDKIDKPKNKREENEVA